MTQIGLIGIPNQVGNDERRASFPWKWESRIQVQAIFFYRWTIYAERMGKGGWVYMLTNKRRTTLYIGVTSDLTGRIDQHNEHAVRGFTSQYNIDMLVYVEEFPAVEDAIAREKQLKKWNRAWKEALIEERNPQSQELAYDFVC